MREFVKIECEIKTETSSSLLIIIEGRTLWIPRSQIDAVVRERSRQDGGHDGYIMMSRWLADKEEIEYDLYAD